MTPDRLPAGDLERHWVASAAPWLVFLALLAVCELRWYSQLTISSLQIDERSYFAAFEAVTSGRSPYEARSYLYPPLLATLGAEAVARCGERATSLTLRHLNLVAAALLAWLASRFLATRLAFRFFAAAAAVAVLPGFAAAIVRGNLSPLAAALALAGWLLWPKRALIGGALLALSLFVKPMAILVPLVLLVGRLPDPAESRQRQWTLLSMAASAVLLLIPGLRHLEGLASQVGGGKPEALRVASLHRVLDGLGWRLPAGVIALVIALVTAIVLRRRPLTPRRLGFVAWTASLLALPIVWDHTLLLALPVVAASLRLAGARWLARDRVQPRPKPGEAWLVGLATTSVALANGFGAIETLPTWLNALLVAIPTLSPLVLTLFLIYAGGQETVSEPATA